MGIKDIFIKVDGTTKPMRKEVDKLGNKFAAHEKNVKKFNNSIGNISKDATSGSKAFGQLTKSIGAFGTKMYLVTKVAQGLAVAINGAMDIAETSNKFNVAMGSNTEEAEKFVQQMHEAFSMDTTNLRDAVGTFGLLARSMGISGKNALTLSTNTTKLAADLSSLNNVPIKQSLRDLQSGLLGQSETVYKYGIDVTEAALKTTAMSLGIEKSVRNMSQGEKMALRYVTMIRQTTLAHGDFAKTINTAANQMRIAMDRIVSLSRTLGTVFLPLLEKILPIANATLDVTTQLLAKLAAVLGYKPPDHKNIQTDIENLGGAYDDATNSVKKFKNASIGLDELNVISPTTSGGSGAIAGDLDIILEGYDNMMSHVKDKSKEIAEAIMADINMIGGVFKPITDILLEFGGFLNDEILVPLSQWTLDELMPSTLELLGAAIQVLAEFIEANKPILKWFWDNFLKPISNWVADIVIDSINALTSALTNFADWISEHQEIVRGFTITILSFFAAWTVLDLLAGLGMLMSGQGFGGLIGSIVKLTGEMIKNIAMTLALKLMYAGDVLKAIGTFTVKIWAMTSAFFAAHWQTVLLIGSIGLLIGGVVAFAKAWDSMSGLEKAVGILSALAAAATAAAIAIAVFHTSWTIGVAAATIAAGVALLTTAFLSVKNVKIPAPTVNAPEMPEVPQFKVPKYAHGGYLDGGDLFVAGERGKAEMIGSHNGRTTVMPLEDTDFVSAIHDAVLSAMQSVGGGQTIENVLTLDGEVIYRSVENTKQQKGYQISTVRSALV